ncbi:MAG: hypothetical protein ACD_73C00784G0003, partial [uncultured bacterium]
PYPAIDLGHSSAHAAFYILQRLGCNPIYLIGQDLCYYEGATHAEGTWEASQKSIQNIDAQKQRFLDVMGNNGQKVKTNPFWHTYLKTFSERTLPQYSGIVYNVIDAQKGALIPGTQRMNPKDLGASLTTIFPILEPLTQKLKNISPHEKWVQQIKPRLNKVQEMLGVLANDAFSMAMDCKKFQFHEAISSKDWGKAKPVYEAFMQKVMKYSSRYRTDEKLKNQKQDYELFFHSIIQGLFLRHRIEYFAKAGEEKGDVSEISRKAEILFHMSKDEAFWAKAINELIQ